MKKLIAILLLSFSMISYSQTSVEYELNFNNLTGLYEARVNVVAGAVTQPVAPFAQIGSSSFCIVVPSSVPNTEIFPNSVAPSNAAWINLLDVFQGDPNATNLPSDVEYRKFITGGSGSPFPTFQTGDSYLLFTFSLPGGCIDGVRMFNNGSFASGGDGLLTELGGEDMDNSFQFVTGEQYVDNTDASFVYIQNTSGDWEEPGNWTIGRVPPPSANNVRINPGVNTTINADHNVVNLEIGANSTVTIGDGFSLNVGGDITNAGEFSGLGVVVLNGTCGPQDLIGTGSYDKLIADNPDGVNVTESTVINGYLNVDNGNFSTNNATTFPCDFNNPNPGGGTIPSPNITRFPVGQIGPVTATGSITGEVTVEQCFPGRRAFRLVSATTTGESMHNAWQENPSSYTDDPRPGYGTHITGLAPGAPNALGLQGDDQLNGLDWQPSGDVSVFRFNNATQNWDDVLDTEGTTLDAGDPYLMMIRGSRAVNLEINTSPTSNTKLESTGTADVGSISVNPNISNGQFALIGNPYHAVVDLSTVVPGNGYTNFVTYFDPNLGGTADVNSSSTNLGGRGGYVTVDLTNNNVSVATGITGVTATDVSTSQFAQPYQAFFVQAASTGTPGAITFEETDKSVTSTQIDVFDTSQPRIFVTLFDQVSFDNQNSPDDGLVIYFSPNSSNEVDDNDAPKFFNQDEVIARNENGNLVSFENRAMPVEDDVLELYTDQYRDTNYVLEVGVEFLPNQTVYLHDKYTNTEVALNNNASNTYEFAVDQSNPASVASDRFEILFRSTTMGTNEFDLQGISVYPNPASDMLNIGFGENIGRFDSIELFDISGRLVAKQSVSNQLQETQVDVNTFSSGVYLLKVSSETEQFTTKVIVE